LLLADSGWQVHLLDCAAAAPPEDENAPGRDLAGAGVGYSRLQDFPLPAALQVPGQSESPFLATSERVRYALEELHRRHRFTLVEFPERGAAGFRAIQARRFGLTFADLRMVVKLHGSGQWLREAGRRWLEQPEDLECDYCERYSFAHADVQLSLSPDLLDHACSSGWQVREGALVMDPPSLPEDSYRAFVLPKVEDPGEISYNAPHPVTPSGCHPVIPSSPQGVIPPASAEYRPLVSVVIPFYNLGAYLPAALDSLASQTYPHLDVIVIDDGSTDPYSLAVFSDQQRRFPQFRFLSQANAGIGATRNRGLSSARGELFLPMDADNVAFPFMVERFVRAMKDNPQAAALTCFFLAFKEGQDPLAGEFEYAFRPVGGPRVLAGLRNVYGDANAIFRTEVFRAVGGYETDRDTSWEDWEAFLKLVNAGREVDVIPDYLFAYRHRDSGFSRVTQPYRNHQRVLRQMFRTEQLSKAEKIALWNALVGFQKRQEALASDNRALQARLGAWRYRVADGLWAIAGKLPVLGWGAKHLVRSGSQAWKFLASRAGPPRKE
jgi:glycosyltransferase involved in cell wall biosynthesis